MSFRIDAAPARRLAAVAAAALLLSGGNAIAQTGAPPPAGPGPAAAPAPAPDPARLAVAQRVVLKLLPPGIYKRLFSGAFQNMMGSMPDLVGGMPMREVAAIGGLSDAEAEQLGDAKIGELMDILDPHWHERMQLTMTAVSNSLGDLMSEVEPQMRDALARAYAREFSVEELTQLDQFFATPVGSHYAEKQFAMFVDPEAMKAMTAMMPAMMKKLPDMIAAVKDATKDLPPARKFKDLSPAERARFAQLLGVSEEQLAKTHSE